MKGLLDDTNTAIVPKRIKPPGKKPHRLVYIDDDEAAMLRARGGGVAPGGGQIMRHGLPSFDEPGAASDNANSNSEASTQDMGADPGADPSAGVDGGHNGPAGTDTNGDPGGEWLPAFRELFGDENQDYAESLKKSYEEGPRSDWPLHFVSAYASVHPWEDWAECWAHYMHMRDTVDTAASYGLSMDTSQFDFTPFDATSLYLPEHPDAERFLAFLNHWTQLTMLLNGMSRAMGQPDFYPFVLPHEVVAKLHFIHLLVASASVPADAAAVGALPNT